MLCNFLQHFVTKNFYYWQVAMTQFENNNNSILFVDVVCLCCLLAYDFNTNLLSVYSLALTATLSLYFRRSIYDKIDLTIKTVKL